MCAQLVNTRVNICVRELESNLEHPSSGVFHLLFVTESLTGLELSQVGQTGWRTSSRICCSASPLAVTGVAGNSLLYIIVDMGYRGRILSAPHICEASTLWAGPSPGPEWLFTESLPCTKYFISPLLSS